MKIQIIDKTKKKKFIEEVSYLGLDAKNIPYLFIRTGQETVRAYSGSLTNEEIMKIWSLFPIEGVGLYFGKEFVDKHGNKEARLSLDALHVLKDQIKGNIIEINNEQEKNWFLGRNVELTIEQKEKYKNIHGFVAVKSEEDFLGTAKISGEGILMSFLPKERWVRENN